MKKQLWTVFVLHPFMDGALAAQCKGSVNEAIRRVVADDPIWGLHRISVRRAPMFAKSAFRRGLAIRFIPRMRLLP